MRALSSVGVGLAVVSSLLLLALTAELYYIFIHKRRHRRRSAAISDAASSPSSSSRELLQLFCFKKPPPAAALASTYAVPEPASAVAVSVGSGATDDDDEEESVEAQLMRLGSIVGPTRLLFTIKEETREDLIESEDGGTGRRGRNQSSLGDLLLHCAAESTPPFLTPRASPSPRITPRASPSPMDNSYNPLFESPVASPGPPAVSPPPKFQFLRDAEEKLYRRALAEEEAMRARRSPKSLPVATAEEENGGYITIVVAKNNSVVTKPPSPSPSPSPPNTAAAAGSGDH